MFGSSVVPTVYLNTLYEYEYGLWVWFPIARSMVCQMGYVVVIYFLFIEIYSTTHHSLSSISFYYLANERNQTSIPSNWNKTNGRASRGDRFVIMGVHVLFKSFLPFLTVLYALSSYVGEVRWMNWWHVLDGMAWVGLGWMASGMNVRIL